MALGSQMADFLRDDGYAYNPSDAQGGFIKSTARNVMIYGPRGCIAGETIVGGSSNCTKEISINSVYYSWRFLVIYRI